MTQIMQTGAVAPFLSVIVPVYNGGTTLTACLAAIANSDYADWELIVVDDGSSDDSAAIAQQFPARVVRSPQRQGAAAARNCGAERARGTYLCFIDADCEVHPNTLTLLAQFLQQHPTIDAVFGSYDDAPQPKNFIAQYRNLLHHYVHQTAWEEASTFWTGCGAVRTALFHAIGGFDPQIRSLEDVDLGSRIRQAGGNIYLAKHIQVKHHKAWNLLSLVKTDVFDRGIPWTLLLLSRRASLVNDLNLHVSSRLSVIAVYGLLLLLGAGWLNPALSLLAMIPVTALLQMNWQVYRFFCHKRGKLFALRAIGLHWLYYGYCGVSLLSGLLLHGWRELYKETDFARMS